MCIKAWVGRSELPPAYVHSPPHLKLLFAPTPARHGLLQRLETSCMHAPCDTRYYLATTALHLLCAGFSAKLPNALHDMLFATHLASFPSMPLIQHLLSPFTSFRHDLPQGPILLWPRQL